MSFGAKAFQLTQTHLLILNRLGSFLKQRIAKIIARKTKLVTDKWSLNPVKTQDRVFKRLLKSAQNTKFGQDHNFSNVNSHQDFVDNIPIRDYEARSTDTTQDTVKQAALIGMIPDEMHLS